MKEFDGVRYEGYDPQTERCKFSVPKGYGTAIPYPNARLISAAPELLEAAKAILYKADEFGGIYSDFDEEFAPFIARLEAAIAKTEEKS